MLTGFGRYDPLEEGDALERECVIHGDDEHAEGEVHVNTCENHG
jgi:hypothetical protein